MKNHASRPSGESPVAPAKRQVLKRSLALEPRVLLDAAAVETAIKAASGVIVSGPASAPVLPTGHEVVFVDGGVANLSQILQGIDLSRYDVHVLDASRDGFSQMADILSTTQGVTGIHVISHGADGALQLGNVTLTEANIASEQANLLRIGQSLKAGADIMIYGCDIAADIAGRQFVDALSIVTGHDVAASEDVTGITGNWALEYHQGLITTHSLDIPGYQKDLALDVVQAGTNDYGTAASNERGWAMSADGSWVAAGNNGSGAVTLYYLNGTSRTVTNLASSTATVPSGGSAWSTQFGRGLAIWADPTDPTGTKATLVVTDPGTQQVAIYMYNTSTSTWDFKSSIKLPTSGMGYPTDNAKYGEANNVAIDGNHIAIGMPNEGSNTGAIFWMATATNDWTDIASHNGVMQDPGGSNSNSNADFGAAVSLANNYMVVGAPTFDTSNDGGTYGSNYGNQGEVFVYTWTAGATTGPTGTVVTSYANNGGTSSGGARFGSAISLEYYNSNYFMAIGSPGDVKGGSVYVWQTADLSTITWSSNLYLNDQTNQTDTDDRYGSSVAVSQGRLLVGAFNESGGSNGNAGYSQPEVFYYEDDNGTWATGSYATAISGKGTFTVGGSTITYATITSTAAGITNSSDTTYGARFGWSVGFAQGNLIVVGAPGAYTNNNTASNSQAGSVSFFYARTPVAADDALIMGENATAGSVTLNGSAVTISTPGVINANILGNDVLGSETSSTITVSVLGSTFLGTATWDNTNKVLVLTPGTNYDYLSVGQTASAVVEYQETSADGKLTTQGFVNITINGQNDVPVYVAGSIPTLAGNRRIDTNGDGTFESNGGTVGYYTGDPSTPSYQIQAGSFADPDQADTLTYSLDAATTSAAIASMITVSATGKITWNLTTGVTENTSYNVGVKASDGNGGSAVGVITFTVKRDDTRPQTVSASLPASNTIYWTQGTASTQSVTSWFKDNDTSNAYSTDEAISYSISYTGPGSSSGWLSIRSDTGLLQGTATNANVGNTTVTVTATDKYGQQVSYNLTLDVLDVNDAPQLQGSVGALQAGQGTAFTYQLPGWATTGSVANQTDDLFTDPDAPFSANPGHSTITYTAALVDSSGNLVRTLSSSTGSGTGGWLTFSGGTYDTFAFSTTGTATFGGTSNDAIGTKLYVRVTATDNGIDWTGPSTYTADPKSTTYTFTLQTFAPTISVGPVAAGGTASEMGTSVSISRDGTYMVAGAPNLNEEGGITTYFWGGSSWSAVTTQLTTPAAVVAGDRFGQSVSLDYNGDRLLVGAPGTDSGAGVVYAFSRGATSGTSTAWTLTAVYKEAGSGNVRNAGDGFGSSLAFYTDSNNANDGQSFLVGTPFDSDSGAYASGKVFVYGWSTTSTYASPVNPNATITPITDSGDTDTSYDEFGFSISESGGSSGTGGGYAVIGAPGDTHNGYFMAGSANVVLIGSAGTVTPTAGAVTKISLGTNSGFGDMFGYSVSIVGFNGTVNASSSIDTLLLAVGTPGSNSLGSDAGAVYLYRADTLSAATLAAATPTKITAYDGTSYQYFGSSVAVSVAGGVEGSGATDGTDRVLIGSQQTADQTGSVYMFRYKSAAWNGQRFSPSGTGAVAGSFFGRSVDIALFPTTTTTPAGGPNWVAGAPDSNTGGGYDGRIYTSTANNATALSVASGSTGTTGGLVPMSTTTSSTSTSSSGLISLVSPTTTTSSTSGSGMTTSGLLSSSTLQPLSTTTTSTGTITTSTTTQTFSDMLLMDMMTQDPLSGSSTSGTCVSGSSTCVADVQDWSGGGLSRQVHHIMQKRDSRAQSFLDSLEQLAS